MRTIKDTKQIEIPRGVTVTVKARQVTVVGPRGSLTRDFRHFQCNLHTVKRGRALTLEVWFGTPKQKACIRSITSHIANMITGVTSGFEYKLRFVYAHFPTNAVIPDDGSWVEIRNFLGEKNNRMVKMAEGCTVARGTKKDELVIVGNSIDDVSQSAARVHECALVKRKDIRKFLDGIYVSEAGILKSA
eukprot:TRINITY_DN14729_c0_g1_i1.p2 TRINITY_DN14729_c0_g1~~TRINITY_DN14729_c0_g1_i1.p2  ORF type:complete len:189 (-),score=53.29 TRINITY_DN14729_c0_g1_i1:72-638(-)